ncbi:MAG TPA: efflux RND transporter periplasmic adaptor subunit, partial [Usitatibacteraceae bacterium]|nr:efflux RND transporter periplasmic adaptor subunit [Usitatibacteraceae bacterium]
MLFRKKDPASADASARRRRLAKPAAAALVLVLAAGSLVAFRVSSARKEEPAKAPDLVLQFTPADVAVVELRELARAIPISGSLSPLTQSTVRSKVPGEVRRVHVREGERVAQGQLLAEIDTADLQARLDAQVASLEEARAKLSMAEKNRDNGMKLHKQGFISQNAFDTTQSQWEAAMASVKSAEAQARLARNATQDAVVRSPIEGIVAKRAVHPGEKVGIDGELFTIVDLARMEVEAPVPASEIPGIRVGQVAKLRVDGFGEREFAGRLERINPTTELASRAITVYLSVSNRDGLLRGGMFAKGSLVLDRGEPAAVIPATAVREEAGQAFVFTIEKGKLERRPVALGLREEQAGIVQVRSGLEKGAMVVSSRAMGLKAGTPAVLKEAGTPAAKPAAGT